MTEANNLSLEKENKEIKRLPRLELGLSIASWIIAAGMVALLVWVIVWKPKSAQSSFEPAPTAAPNSGGANLPTYVLQTPVPAVERKSKLHTDIPQRENQQVIEYTVQKGDNIFSLSEAFKIKPETILWANYEELNGNPEMLSPGKVLKIPPVDGVYYKWEKGDSLKTVAQNFKVSEDTIINWSGNNLDLTDLEVDPGTYVMIEGGSGDYIQWGPVAKRVAYSSGASFAIYGDGACSPSDGAVGTGTFTWPGPNHSISGYDFVWGGHHGIDVAATEGTPIFVSDGGVVIFSGFANYGYGGMIVIDHRTGYQTLYAHLSNRLVSCGASVTKGQTIGAAGATGNAFGAHLHFEVRSGSAFINPHDVLGE